MSSGAAPSRFPSIFSLVLAVCSVALIYVVMSSDQLLPDEEIERYALGLAGLAWILGTFTGLFGLGQLYSSPKRTGVKKASRPASLLAALLILALAIPEFLYLAVERISTSATRTRDMYNLKQLALAMHEYARAHNGTFPPAAT